MSFKNVLVTGANRGIGLEFIKQLLELEPKPKNIIATTRNECEHLNKLKNSHDNLHILKYDALEHSKLDEFVQNVQQIVGNDGLNLLVNNAGVLLSCNLDMFEPAIVMKNIEINAVAPIYLTRKLLPLLKESSKQQVKTVVAQISSSMGSIDDNTSGGHYAYRSSKSALNMMSKSLAIDLKRENIIVLILHPGWVQTDMGSSKAPVLPQTSVSGMLNVIKNVSIDKVAQFVDYNGIERKW